MFKKNGSTPGMQPASTTIKTIPMIFGSILLADFMQMGICDKQIKCGAFHIQKGTYQNL